MASTFTSSAAEKLRVFVWTYSLQLIAASCVIRLLWNKFQTGLVCIPGPTIAAYTKFWRVYDVWRGQAERTAIDLHRKHGSVVRIAPNHVSISDPAFIPVIYNVREDFVKSEFYPIQSITWRKKPAFNLFSTSNVEDHRSQRRKTGAAYSLPNVIQSEDAIDSCVTMLTSRLGTLASRNEPVDLGAWLQYFAFDVVGEISFAEKFGFLDQGRDVDGIIKAIATIIPYSAICGQVPEYHKYLLGNPVAAMLMPAMEDWDSILKFTLKAINGRARIERGSGLIKTGTEGNDMLTRWAHVQASDPAKMSTRDIVVHLSANVFAGSDTTAIALRATLYYLCRNPDCKSRLVAEIDEADRTSQLGNPISYRHAHRLPYLIAVIKESIRLHPPLGLLLERHVPTEGLSIAGYHLPAGTIVGINPWVVCRDEAIFPEPDNFRPDRWLDSSEQNLKAMDTSWEFSFGGGSRKCIGRHLAWVEMIKVVSELFRQFDINLAHPDKEWRYINRWFVQQEGVICTLVKR